MATPLSQDQRDILTDANLIQQAQQASIGTATEDAYQKSLASPDEIKKLREEALQAIRRNENAAATPGTSLGLNEADWMSIQSILPKLSTDFGGLAKSPSSIFDFSPMMAEAAKRSEYNKQYGKAEEDAFKGLTNTRQGAEAAYSAPILTQTQPNAMLDPLYAQAKANIASINTGTAGTQQAIQQAANQPKNVDIQGGFGNIGKTIQDINDPTQFELPPTATSTEKQARQEVKTAWHDLGANDFERNRNLNVDLKTQAANYNKSSQNNPALIESRQNRVKDVLNKLDENSFSNMIQTAQQGATKEDFVNPQNLFAKMGQAVGIGSEGQAMFSTIAEILPSLPPEDQNRIKEQMQAGTINKTSLTNLVNSYARKSQSEYYTQRLADKLLNTAPQYTQGVSNGQKMVTTLRSSPTFNTTLKTDDGTPYQQKFLESLDNDYNTYYKEHPNEWEDHVYKQLQSMNRVVKKNEEAQAKLLNNQTESGNVNTTKKSKILSELAKPRSLQGINLLSSGY